MMRCAVLVALVLAACSAPNGQAPHDGFRVTDEMRIAAIESANIGVMRDSLDYIGAWHVDKGTGIIPLLKPGLDDPAIDAIESELGCELPRELRSLWRWKNGHPDTSTAHWFVWYHQFMPAEEAMEQYRYLRSMPLFEWDPSWVPVMFFQEEWYFVECGQATVEASPVMYYFTETGPRQAYRNLTSYFATAREAMENGAVFIEGDEVEMGRDIKAMAAAHAKHNPGLEFPYFVPE